MPHFAFRFNRVFWLPVVLVSLWPNLAFCQTSRELSGTELADRARAALSPLEGRIHHPALREPVEVLRDRWGIAHIYAQTTHDLFFAQGVVVAQDRLFQIDLWRRVGRGETAEWFGEESLPGDQFARLIRYRGDMDAEWSSYSPDAREIIQAFTAGINAHIDSLGDRLPIEFQLLGVRPARWQPEDVISRMSGIVMTGNWQRELTRARLMAAVGVEATERLTPTDPPRRLSIDSRLDLTWLDAPISHGYNVATRSLLFKPSFSESNNWVVAGRLSASGKPLLASDPHRTIAIPSLRYLVHLNAPDWNVIGSGEPSLPGVAIGHNERMAWGFTIIGTDQSDVFVHTTHPDNPRLYRVGDSWKPMETITEQFSVRGRKEPLERELRFTQRGPVIYQDEARRVAFSLRWSGAEPGGAAYLGSLAVARARNSAEFLQALERWKVPGLNFVYADVDGDIGWVAAALTPKRRGRDGLLPILGDDPANDWDGFLPLSELPQSFNPPQGWLATANHNIVPTGYPHEIGYDFEAPYRYDRIRDALQARTAAGATPLTLDDFQRLQHDATSLAARQLVKALAQVPVEETLVPYQRLLVEWDGHLARPSPAAPLYAAWLQELEKSFWSRTPLERIPASDRGSLRKLPFLIRAFTTPEATEWGEQPVAARNAAAIAALRTAVERTTKTMGENTNHWRWDRIHTAEFRHPLSGLGEAHEKLFNRGPVPRAGDVTTPHNTRYDEQFRQVHGASYRHVLDLSDWDRGLATSAPGQSGQPMSPHYDDLLPLWTDEKYFPLAYSREKVEQVSAHRLLLTPRMP